MTTDRSDQTWIERSAPDPAAVLASAVVVTGGGSGLGRASALRIAAGGRAVGVWDLDGARARAVALEVAERGVASVGLGVDVADRAAVDTAAATTVARLGAIGGLVCGAGILRLGSVGAMRRGDWELTMGVNLDGVLFSIEALLPALREVGPGASIVAIASTESVRGHPAIAAYTASKHAVLGLVRSAALSLGPEGIRVNALCPGAVDTPMLRAGLAADAGLTRGMETSIVLGYLADPAEVAHVASFLISPEASYITGQAIVVDGGMNA